MSVSDNPSPHPVLLLNACWKATNENVLKFASVIGVGTMHFTERLFCYITKMAHIHGTISLSS